MSEPRFNEPPSTSLGFSFCEKVESHRTTHHFISIDVHIHMLPCLSYRARMSVGAKDNVSYFLFNILNTGKICNIVIMASVK